MANKENLKLLVDGLRALPEDYDQFDMTAYFTDAGGNIHHAYLPVENINVCGTCACVVGHGPTIPGLEALPNESWDNYEDRVFAPTWLEFKYLFGPKWAQIDNTLESAIDRIDTYLKEGIPDDFPY